MKFSPTFLATLLVLVPFVGGIALLFVPARQTRFIWIGAIFTGAVEVFLGGVLYALFDGTSHAIQFAHRVEWIPQLGASWFVGIDGISLFLVLLTAFLVFISLIYASCSISQNVKMFALFFLWLEGAMIGAFVALDILLVYIFWEMMLVPMYFLIGVWGGDRRIYATYKFVLYTVVGGLLMLAGILYVVYMHEAQFGVLTTNLLDLYKTQIPVAEGWKNPQLLAFLAFFLAFAIKIPLFPFHTWLPDAHVEAPTVGSVILAGILLKMGAYGLIRFSIPLFPEAAVELSFWLMALGLVGILYGAMVSMVQPDLKKLIAYSSISHMGFVVLGIASLNETAIQGGLYQMLSHGVSTGALFLAVGCIYTRCHTRIIAKLGGLSGAIPLFATFFLILVLSSIGLPGTNGFVGEFLILLGTFQTHKWFAAAAVLGIVLGAVYMLQMFQRVMYGKLQTHGEGGDLNWRERAALGLLVAFVFLMGLYPRPILEKMTASVSHLARHYSDYQLSLYGEDIAK
ncbi:MAG: NADH-quinone oxidoreductase subunit M [Deltaproteobacteria bacterium]|nr:NADH-quinone oxidoreductase subunit M [Deltaproteobacteria bacterium]